MNTIFDIRTLVATLCITMLALSICLTHYFYSRKTYNGFGAWTLGSILHALGFLLIGLRATLPDFISIVMANSFLFWGTFFFYRGFKSFADEKVKTSYHITILLICTLIIFPFFTYISPDVSARVVIFSLIAAIYFFFSARVFAKIAQRTPSKSNKLLMVALISLSTIYQARAIFYLFPSHNIDALMSAGIFYELALLVTVILSIFFVIGLMQLNSSKLEIELLQGHDQLMHNKEKFQALAAASFEGIIIHKNGSIIEANNQTCKMFGYQAAEIIGVKTINLVIPEHRTIVKSKIQSNQEQAYEITALRCDGSTFPLEVQVKAFQYQGDKTRVVSLRDITKRKQAARELKKLDTAIRQSPLLIVMTDPEGNIEYVNPKFCQVTGYTVEEVLGKTPHLLSSGTTPKATYEQLWQTITAGKEWHGELYNKKKNDDRYWENVVIAPIFDENQNITNFLGMKEDITGRKLAEEERERLIKELQNAAEEIKTLGSLLPICSHCKKIRDDQGYWNILESYIQEHTNTLFSHGICPVCLEELYGQEEWYIKWMNEKGDT